MFYRFWVIQQLEREKGYIGMYAEVSSFRSAYLLIKLLMEEITQTV